jgi:hypothetical protein
MLSLTLFTHRLIAQKKHFTANSPYQLVYDKENSQIYLTINFIDTNTRQIINSFDLAENNPYNNLEYTELERNSFDQPNRVYNLSKGPLDKINLNGCNLVIRENIKKNQTYTELTGWNFYQAFNMGEYLLVHYSFYLNSGDALFGRSDAILVFDKNGNQLYTVTGFDTNVREWGLTKNGRYFSYAYGGALDESLYPFSTVGYKVFDLVENKIVFQEDFGYQFNEVRTRGRGNIISAAGFSIDKHYTFLDFSRNELYKRTFSRKELELWKDMTPEGLVFYVGKRNSEKTKTLTFKDDFEVQKIQLIKD